MNVPVNDPILTGIQRLLREHSDKRVIVVGSTCTGKTTILRQMPGARDQDREVFPKLTPEESAYVCQVPWTEDIGATMKRLVRERIQSEVGRPVFGTVVIESDLIILLKISDDLLRHRASQRGVEFSDAKLMQAAIERDVRSSGIPWIEFEVG